MRITSAMAVLAAGIVSVAPAEASGDADLDALTLADQARATDSAPSRWHGAFEFAAANYDAAAQMPGTRGNDTIRAASSLSYDGAVFDGWRAVYRTVSIPAGDARTEPCKRSIR